MAIVAAALPAAQARSDDYAPGALFRDCPDCPQMVVVPPGRYVKGSPPGEALAAGTPERDARNETPQEQVRVGSFKPNGFGVHDMLGNAWEWVDGCMYTAPGAGEPVTENCNERLIRGGAWQAKAWYVRSAKRDWAPYFLRSARVGLRIARDLH